MSQIWLKGMDDVMAKRKITGICLLLGLLMLAGWIQMVKACEPYQEQEIAFSLKDSFYSEDQELILSTLLDADIY